MMPSPRDLVAGVDSLSTIAAVDLRSLWRSVTTPAEAREALADVLPALVRTYGAAAATLAADWYDDTRLEVGAAGRFRSSPAVLGNSGTDALAGWAVSPLFQAEPDWRRSLTLVEGGLQRRISNMSRQTVIGASVADPAARGWQRVGVGACAFCAMLISRGAVFTESTAAFAAHDACACQAVPAFGGQPLPVQSYTPSDRIVTDADRKRVSEYLQANKGG